MENCIFCKIIKKQISSYKILESDLFYAFLDVDPVIEGHALAIPKKHFKDFFELDETHLKEYPIFIKKIGELLRTKLNCDGINMVNANGKAAQQSVFHQHFHIIPRYDNDTLDLWLDKKNQQVNKDFEATVKKITE